MSVIDLAVRRDVGGRRGDRLGTALINDTAKALLVAFSDPSVAQCAGPSNRHNSPIGGFALIKVRECSCRIFEDRLAGFTRYGAFLCAPINIGAEVRCVDGALRPAGILIPALLAEIDALPLAGALVFGFEGIATDD